jgi:hypothetical protein
MPNAKLWPQRKAQPGFPALEPSPRNSKPHLGLCTRWPRFSANSLLTFQVRIASQATRTIKHICPPQGKSSDICRDCASPLQREHFRSRRPSEQRRVESWKIRESLKEVSTWSDHRTRDQVNECWSDVPISMDRLLEPKQVYGPDRTTSDHNPGLLVRRMENEFFLPDRNTSTFVPMCLSASCWV